MEYRYLYYIATSKGLVLSILLGENGVAALFILLKIKVLITILILSIMMLIEVDNKVILDY